MFLEIKLKRLRKNMYSRGKRQYFYASKKATGKTVIIFLYIKAKAVRGYPPTAG
jgi:hypothetical protein